ncbi:class I SAM-dependent methyltransferase [Thalassotalea maritima]|uniref:class I SAM-dependent methyltransferase n=1 Tax=Thalassotalea maritima TaxID=3242416 RepID=UPI003528C578
MKVQELLQLIDLSDIDDHECGRLFHGRGHAYPGYEHINIDYFPPMLLITVYQETDADFLQQLSEQLHSSINRCNSVKVQYRCRPKAPFATLVGESIESLVAIEHGLKFQLHFSENQNFGLFLDMRNGRRYVLEHSEGKSVLNLFAYTCAFSVAAIAGNAAKVVNIDISKAALSKGRDNHRLNKHPLEKVRFEGVDIFKSYNRLKKHGPYDLLIADPPSFQKGSIDVKRDYPKIIRRLDQFMAEDGLLMLCLNSPDLSEEFLFSMMNEYSPNSEFVEHIEPPAVFKEAYTGKGLKVLVFRYKK